MSSRHSSVSRPSAPNTPHLPTRDEIQAECARIRAGWDESERRARAGLPPGHDLVELVMVTPGVLEGRR